MSCCIYCVYSLVLQQEQDSHPVSTFGTSETCLFKSEAILTKKKKFKRIYIFIVLALKCFNTVLCIHMACYYRYMYFIVAIKLTVTAGLMVIFEVKIIIKRV